LDKAKLDKLVSAFQPVEKHSETVREVYDEHWGKRIAGLKKKIESGEHISHILSSLRRPPHQIAGYNRVAGEVAKEFLRSVDGRSEQGLPLSRLGVSEGRYTTVPNFDPLTAISRLSSKHRNIVELGAGPGWNLFDLCIHLGSRSKNCRLFGLEYTQPGVEIMRMLAQHADAPIHAHLFDYTKPDLSMLPDDGPTLFFSHHSIEQVEDISPDLYKQMLARRTPVTLVHCEPVGWQRFRDILKARQDRDQLFFRNLIAHRLDDTRSPTAPALNAAINSNRVGYNRNLLPLMADLIRSGRVDLRECIFDFTQRLNTNPVNCSSYFQMDVVPASALRSEQEIEHMLSMIQGGPLALDILA
jgi:hypothetical protein